MDNPKALGYDESDGPTKKKMVILIIILGNYNGEII